MNFTLNWAAADFEEGASIEPGTYSLHVLFDRPVPGPFVNALTEEFDATAGEVRGGRWGLIRVTSAEITVLGVGEGSQKPLRAHLDSSVLRAHDRFRGYEERKRRFIKEQEEARADRQRTAQEMTESIRQP